MAILGNILDKPVVEFNNYSDMFDWNFFYHIPVLAPKWINNNLGIDLISFSGSEAQAKRFLLQIAILSRNFAFGKLPNHSRDFQIFLMSRDLELIKNFLDFQSTFVIAGVNSGSIYEFLNIQRTASNTPGLDIAASQLKTKFWTPSFYSIPEKYLYKGY